MKPNSGTEKVDIIRDLIIDLRTRAVNDAFKDAFKKATDSGDKELLKVLEKHFKLKDLNRTIEGQASMLRESYQLYVKADTSLYLEDIKTETLNLAQGRKPECVKLALNELHKKGEALLVATAYNKFFQKSIHSISPKELQKFRTASIEDEIKAIAKKTSLRIDVEKAKVQPPARKDRGNDKGLGAFLN